MSGTQNIKVIQAYVIKNDHKQVRAQKVTADAVSNFNVVKTEIWCTSMIRYIAQCSETI